MNFDVGMWPTGKGDSVLDLPTKNIQPRQTPKPIVWNSLYVGDIANLELPLDWRS